MEGYTVTEDKATRCDCYVRGLDDVTRLSLRRGAHDPACPVYMPSLDRADAQQDAEYRQRTVRRETGGDECQS